MGRRPVLRSFGADPRASRPAIVTVIVRLAVTASRPLA